MTVDNDSNEKANTLVHLPMQNIEIALSAAVDLARAERVIDQTLAEMSLEIALRGPLKKFPGCIHWHAKTSGQTGTLEITLWPREQRVWITIQSGRTADWIAARLPEIRRAIERHLGV